MDHTPESQNTEVFEIDVILKIVVVVTKIIANLYARTSDGTPYTVFQSYQML